MTAVDWTLTYDDGSRETVRAGSPATAVHRRSRGRLPATVSSRALARHMLTHPRIDRRPLRALMGHHRHDGWG